MTMVATHFIIADEFFYQLKSSTVNNLCFMPMSLATFLASDISLVVINSDTAVMAIALSPRAICVALASTELSTPPEKATATDW